MYTDRFSEMLNGPLGAFDILFKYRAELMSVDREIFKTDQSFCQAVFDIFYSDAEKYHDLRDALSEQMHRLDPKKDFDLLDCAFYIMEEQRKNPQKVRAACVNLHAYLSNHPHFIRDIEQYRQKSNRKFASCLDNSDPEARKNFDERKKKLGKIPLPTLIDATPIHSFDKNETDNYGDDPSQPALKKHKREQWGNYQYRHYDGYPYEHYRYPYDYRYSYDYCYSYPYDYHYEYPYDYHYSYPYDYHYEYPYDYHYTYPYDYHYKYPYDYRYTYPYDYHYKYPYDYSYTYPYDYHYRYPYDYRYEYNYNYNYPYCYPYAYNYQYGYNYDYPYVYAHDYDRSSEKPCSNVETHKEEHHKPKPILTNYHRRREEADEALPALDKGREPKPLLTDYGRRRAADIEDCAGEAKRLKVVEKSGI